MPEKDAKDYADSIHAIFVETSAKNAININEVFVEISEFAAALLNISLLIIVYFLHLKADFLLFYFYRKLEVGLKEINSPQLLCSFWRKASLQHDAITIVFHSWCAVLVLLDVTFSM